MSYTLDALRRVHEPGTFRPKAPRTRWVYVPSSLALVATTPDKCVSPCVACQASTQREPREGDQNIARALAHGPGLPLRVLLGLLRFARPYSGTPTGDGYERLVFNASERITVSDLAVRVERENRRGEEERAQRAVRGALRKLEEARLVEIIDDPGRPSYYVPHAISSPVRIPQHFWTNSWFKRLDGAASLLLLHLLARTHMPLETVVGRRALPRDLSQLARHAQWAHDLSAQDRLPFSPNVRRRALGALEDFGLIRLFETQGKRFILLAEPG